MTTPRTTPTVRLRRLAAELLRLRNAADMTREAVAERSGINVATLYRLEHAKVRPQTRTLVTLLDLYGVADSDRDQLVALLRDARQKSWLQTYESDLPDIYTTYIGFEGEASAVWNFEALYVPGLLQTPEYARAVIRADLPTETAEGVAQRVAVRTERQSVLTGGSPLELWAIADEASLRRQVGGRQVMREQLSRLLEATEAPNVTLQALPFNSGAHAGMRGSFVLMRFDDVSVPDVIYVDSMSGDLFLEADADVRRYTLAFEHLRATALSPDSSKTLIAAIYAEM
jgi:transcriptional regulator with XRE-family HTH domain